MFIGNMELSPVFLGTVAVAFRLGFEEDGTLALIIVGSAPVATLSSWDPLTGTGQPPVVRIPFGKRIVVPAAIQWVSAIGWVGIGCYFGSQAAQLLLHVPFLFAAAPALLIVGEIAASHSSCPPFRRFGGTLGSAYRRYGAGAGAVAAGERALGREVRLGGCYE
jgi:purine-cytosine permease-like protein